MANSNSTDDFDDELLSAYVDDELSAAERAQVEARLRDDPQARQLVEELRSLSSAIRALPRETLGRDLRASIQAEILHAKADDDARNVLPMSQHNRWANYRRGLIWSAITVAAALMLMVFQPEETNHEIGDVAQANRKEQTARDNRRVALDGSLPPHGEMRAWDSPADAAKPSESAQSLDALAEAPAAATPRSGGAPAEGAAGAVDAFAAAAPATVELALTTPDALAEFERLLSEHEIQLDAEPTQFGALGGERQLADESSAVADKQRFARAIEPLDANSSSASDGKAKADAAVGAEVLVEASPAQIDALVAACHSNKAFVAVSMPESDTRLQFYSYAAQPAAPAAGSQLAGAPRGLSAVADGALEEAENAPDEAARTSAPPQNAESKKSAEKRNSQIPPVRSTLQKDVAPTGRAWRVRTRGGAEPEQEKLPPTSPALAAGAAGTRQKSESLAKAPARGAPQPGQVQVLFILRPAPPPAAPPAPPAEPDP